MGNQQTARTFHQKDVDVLVKLSGKTEEEIRQWYEEFHQESRGTDRMNKRQFQLYYTRLRKNPKLEQITDHIFRAFDTDQSGKNNKPPFLEYTLTFFIFQVRWISLNFFWHILQQQLVRIVRNLNMHLKYSISMKMIESRNVKPRKS